MYNTKEWCWLAWIYVNGFIDAFGRIPKPKELEKILGEMGCIGEGLDTSSYLPCGSEESIHYSVNKSRVSISGSLRHREKEYTNYIKQWFKEVIRNEAWDIERAVLAIECSSGGRDILFHSCTGSSNTKKKDTYIYAEIVD